MVGERLSLPLLGATLLVLLAALLAPAFGLYFQGDDIAAMAQRYQSPGEALSGFGEVDPQGWYRPLARLLTSLLYAAFGLNPLAFRLAALLILATLSLVVLRLAETIAGDSQAALAATFFFAVHSVHAFTTFGPSFYPELLYTLFFCLAVLFFLQGGDPDAAGPTPRAARRLKGASLVFFACALLSKEAALTLPFLLALLLAIRPGRRGARDAVRRLAPYFVLLGVDLLWLALTWSRRVALETGGTPVSNVVQAFGWMFNLGPELGAAGPVADGAAMLVLVVVALIWLRLLAAGRYLRTAAVAFGWVLVTLAPALALATPKPYYVLLPLAGAALLFGQAVAGTLHELAGSRGLLAAALFAAVALGSGLKISDNVGSHPLLGGSAERSRRVAEQTLQELPEVPPEVELLVIDRGTPPGSLLWSTAAGQLFELLYPGSGVDVRLTSLGETFSERTNPGLRVLRYRDGRLTNVTKNFRAAPAGQALPPFVGWQPPLLPAVEGRVGPAVVVAGRGHYLIEVPAYSDRTIEVQFTLDLGPVALASFRLGPAGGARQLVSRLTPRGRYRFSAIRAQGDSGWRPLRDPSTGRGPELTVAADTP